MPNDDTLEQELAKIAAIINIEVAIHVKTDVAFHFGS